MQPVVNWPIKANWRFLVLVADAEN